MDLGVGSAQVDSHAAGLGLRTLTLASAARRASALNCGFNAARTALAQIAEKRM